MKRETSTGVQTPAMQSEPNASYAYPWFPDKNDGTYCNPIIYADYSDPDVLRVCEDYYLTASSFNCTPGLPILHSKDLVNWTIINHALKNLPHPRYTEVQPGCGVWAPAIRHHAGKFWIFFPTPDEGIYVVTSEHPAEKWCEPHLLQAGKGLIDPCPFWDDDGRAYLVHAYSFSRAGIKHRLRVCPMAPDGSKLLDEGKIVFHEPETHPTLEGPKFYKRDGWYYILAPAGGVETGWQVALRSTNIFGPYEDKIVLAQGSTRINGPHQGALVDSPKDDWWFVHFQDAGVYGRIVHLQPVAWKNGWPMMGNERDGVGEPVLCATKPIHLNNTQLIIPQTSDEFDAPRLGLQWQWHGNHLNDWYQLGERKSWMRLHPQMAVNETLGRQPNLLLQKFPARTFAVETLFEFAPEQIGEEAGLIVTGQSCASLGIEKTKSGNQLVLWMDGARKFSRSIISNSVRLRVTVRDGGLCLFSFAEAGDFIEFPHSYQAQKGVWIGAKVGLYSVRRTKISPAGHVDVDYFRFS